MGTNTEESCGGKLFDPIIINGLSIKNRIYKAPTFECMSTQDGLPTDKLLKHYMNAAKGGSGLMITGITHVSKEGKAYPHESGIYDDRFIPEWKNFTDRIHEVGGKIVMQISHGGRQTSQMLLDDRKAKAPSSIPNLFYLKMSQRLTDKEILKIINDFGEAGGRVKEAGFDGVQIASSGGYLLAGFLSPITNRRNDDWGGDEKRRFHMFEEVYKAVRKSVGRNYPVLAKIMLGDFSIMGWPFPANYQAALWAQEIGIDALEFTMGIAENITITFCKGELPIDIVGDHVEKLMKTYWKAVALCYKPFSKFKKPYFQKAAVKLKKQGLAIPLLLPGGFRRFDEAERAISGGVADLVGLCRPIIREPHLPLHWMKGNKRDSTCISCNKCLVDVGINANPLRCHYVKEEKESNKTQ